MSEKLNVRLATLVGQRERQIAQYSQAVTQRRQQEADLSERLGRGSLQYQQAERSVQDAEDNFAAVKSVVGRPLFRQER